MKNKDKYTVDELDAMLASIVDEVGTLYKSDSLAKAVPGDEPDEVSEGSEGPAAPVEASPEAPAEQPMDAAPAPDASMEQAPAEGQEMAPDMGAQDGAIEPAPSVDELMAEYSKLDPEQLKMHYLACKGAIMAVMGQGDGAPEAAAPAAAPPVAPVPEASAPPALKGEMAMKGSRSNPNGGMEKSQKSLEIELLKAELKSTKELLASQGQAVDKLVDVLTKPMRKSIKNISEVAFIDKNAEKVSNAKGLSKDEITARLREKARTNLTKSDRDLINGYSLGQVDVSKIDYLLK